MGVCGLRGAIGCDSHICRPLALPVTAGSVPPSSRLELDDSLQSPANTRLGFEAVHEHPTGQTWESLCPHKKMQRAGCQCGSPGFLVILLEAPSYFDR